jgi:hypothetical protein
VKIKAITNFTELEDYRQFWESTNRHPDCDFSQFQLVCQLRQEVECPYVLVIEENKKPKTILVARLEKIEFCPSIGYLKLIRIPAKVITVLTQGLLGEVDDESSRAFFQYLWHSLNSGEADAVGFNNIHEESPLLQGLLIYGPGWWCEKKPIWSSHWTMQLPEKTGLFIKKMKSKHRLAILKRQRELYSDFPSQVSWQWIKKFDDLNILCNRLEMLAARTYQRGLKAGFVDDNEHRKRFKLFADCGQLRVQLLVIDRQVKAFWIGIIYRNVFHSTETAYDPNLQKYQLGTLVFSHMIDNLIMEGISKLDFGLGDADYKQRFGNSKWRETTIQLFAPTIKGATLRSSLGISKFLDDKGRRLFQNVGLLKKIKAGWRRHLRSKNFEMSN